MDIEGVSSVLGRVGSYHGSVTTLLLALWLLKCLSEQKLGDMALTLLLICHLVELATIFNRSLAGHGWQAMESFLLCQNELLFQRIGVTVFIET